MWVWRCWSWSARSGGDARWLAAKVFNYGISESGCAHRRLNIAALRLLSRPLKPAETAILTDSLGKLRAHYVAQPADAAALLGVGDAKSDEKLPKPELAAWTMVCSQLLNLDEVLNK